MPSTKYIRKGRVIRKLTSGASIKHEFINQAKRESRAIQMREDGALGRGSVMLK